MSMSKEQPGNTCSKYHHGDLRNTLIIAAAELIEENGSLDFAMIDAARKAGVSSAAPYRHFKDKDALLEAVAELGFLALSESTRAMADKVQPGSEECVIALGKTYIRFLTNHPEFYDLMWGDMGLRVDLSDAEMKTSGFYILVEALRTWCEANELRNYDALELAVKLWAIAHGLACLAMNGHVKKFLSSVDVYSLLESSTRTFLDGIRQDQ